MWNLSDGCTKMHLSYIVKIPPGITQKSFEAIVDDKADEVTRGKEHNNGIPGTWSQQVILQNTMTKKKEKMVSTRGMFSPEGKLKLNIKIKKKADSTWNWRWR